MADWEDESQESEPVAVAPQRAHNERVFRPNPNPRFNNRGGGARGGRNSSVDGNWRTGEPGNSNFTPQFNTNRYNDGGTRKQITIPSNKVGRVIGKGGSKIRELESESRARVKIGDSDGNCTEITLTGTDTAIATVEEMINELCEETKYDGKT